MYTCVHVCRLYVCIYVYYLSFLCTSFSLISFLRDFYLYFFLSNSAGLFLSINTQVDRRDDSNGPTVLSLCASGLRDQARDYVEQLTRKKQQGRGGGGRV